MPVISGVAYQKFFWANFGIKKERATENNSRQLSTQFMQKVPYTGQLYLALLFFEEWAFFRRVCPALHIYTLLLPRC